MRSNSARFELVAPTRMDDALALVSSGWQPFAGGTDLMVLYEAGKLTETRFAGLWKLEELRGIRVSEEHIELGALTTYTQIRQSALLADEFPLLCRAAAETGGIATQNRGTLGGNIANASPAADSCPPLLVYDAELELMSGAGIRRVPYAGFHTGYKKMLLEPGELIRSIRLPRNNKKGWHQVFRKVGTRRAQAISKVCLAAAARLVGGRVEQIRIAYGSVAPYPLRCTRTEAALLGADPRKLPPLPDETSPIDDLRSTAGYRRRVAGNLLRDFLESLG
ncbi:MAG: FAD binding domain-containing protein [Acidobacteriia bacterium]|nr:FAD binding domain-containing protein [Terriglobia bacterium]